MSWKDIVKAPPFDVQERNKVHQANAMGQLEAKLKEYLDAQLNAYMANNPFDYTFSANISHNKHQELVRLAGGRERLQDAMESMYNVKEVTFKNNADEGKPSLGITYLIVKR